MIDRILLANWLRRLTAAKGRIDEICNRQRSTRHMTYDLEFLIGDMKSELERLPDIEKELDAMRAETAQQIASATLNAGATEVDTDDMLGAVNEP